MQIRYHHLQLQARSKIIRMQCDCIDSIERMWPHILLQLRTNVYRHIETMFCLPGKVSYKRYY